MGKDLNTTTNQQDLSTNNNRISILSSKYEMFTKINRILGHRTNFNKFKRTDIHKVHSLTKTEITDIQKMLKCLYIKYTFH